MALAGALLFRWVHLPLPWMLGPLIATTAASMARLPVAVPRGVRAPMIAVLGVLLGSSFDAEILAGMARWVPSMAMLPVYILLVSVISIAYLRKVARLDRLTAYFASTPGGLAEMMVMGDRMGGDMRTISLIHATRILTVVFTVPFALRWYTGVGAAAAGSAGAAGLGPLDLAILGGCALAGGLLGPLIRLPSPLLLGPMISSAAAHLLGLVDGAPPAAVIAAAQLFLGAEVGCRFRGVDPVHMLRAVLASFGLTSVMLLVSMGFAAGLHLATGLPLVLVILAYVPGGLAEMSIIAFSLSVDPTFVAAHHIARVSLVVMLAPLLFRLYCRVTDGTPPPS